MGDGSASESASGRHALLLSAAPIHVFRSSALRFVLVVPPSSPLPLPPLKGPSTTATTATLSLMV